MATDDRLNAKIPGQFVERVRTNSALNPLLWLCGITLPSSVPAAIWAPPPFNILLPALASAVVLAALVAYFLWMWLAPDRLQSEDYQLQVQRLHLLGDDRFRGKTIEATVMTANTAAQSISSGDAPHE